MRNRPPDSEGEFPEGRAVRRDFARALALLALGAFSIASFLLGSLFLFKFFVHLLLGMPVGDPCCTNILSCRPCGSGSSAHYPYLLLGLFSLFIGTVPWPARRLYLRSQSSGKPLK
jgi:hypothetical protein